MGGRKFFVTVVAIFSLLFMSLPVYAGSYSGDVKTIGGDNPYEITSETNVMLTYNASLGEVDVLFEGTSVSFDKNDDLLSPLIIIEDSGTGMLTQLIFIPENSLGVQGPYQLSITEGYAGGDPLPILNYTLEGTNLDDTLWDIYGTIEYAQVPIPGAIWLLGSGMIGLAGLRRRFRKS